MRLTSWTVLIAMASVATAAIAAPDPARQAPAQRAPARQAPAQQDVDQRIETVRTTLQITSAQIPQWTRFAEAMQQDATATDALFRGRASTLATLNAADVLKSYASVARAYADDTQTLSQAFQPLYASLSEPQKRAADALFRQPASQQAGGSVGGK